MQSVLQREEVVLPIATWARRNCAHFDIREPPPIARLSILALGHF